MHPVPVPVLSVVYGFLHSRLRNEESEIGLEVAVFFSRLSGLPDLGSCGATQSELSGRNHLPDEWNHVGFKSARFPHCFGFLAFVHGQVTYGEYSGTPSSVIQFPP